MQKPYLEAGKIVNTHGVRGEVRIQPWADDAAFLLGFRTFYIDGAPVPVAHSRVHKGMLVVKFQGVDDVNAAMTMKNRVVCCACRAAMRAGPFSARCSTPCSAWRWG